MGKEKAVKEKPLDKMTSTELREIAKEIQGITGVHGMNKPELLSEIKKARGIEDTGTKKNVANIRELKQKIKSLKVKQQEAMTSEDLKMAAIFRKQVNRLKKKTRRA